MLIPGVLADVDAIAEHIARDLAAYAAAIVARAINAIRKLEQFPPSGRVVPELGREAMREVVAYSYRIIYRIEDGHVTIVAVLHGRRRFDTGQFDSR